MVFSSLAVYINQPLQDLSAQEKLKIVTLNILRYNLQVIIDPVSPGDSPLKYKQEIAVQNKVTFPDQLKEEMETQLKGCCMGTLGVIPMKVVPNKRTCYPGDVLDVDVSIDMTRMKNDCATLHLCLRQFLYLNTGYNQIHKSFEYKVKVELPAPKAGEIANHKVKLQIPKFLSQSPPISS